jgi:CrcB protein
VTTLLVAAGAAFGAPVRYVVAHLLDDRFPHGTLLVNVVGSFLLGVFSGLSLSGSTMALLGVGFCGGLTTYSAFAVQVHDSGARRGAAYAVMTIGLSLAACAAGFAIYA